MLLFSFLLSLWSYTSLPASQASYQAVPENGVSHQIWNELLQQYVSKTGKVNYLEWQQAGDRLDEYLELLAENPVQKDWSRAEKMAYWINAYNAFTVKLILDHYPVGSIRDIHDGNPWDVEWITLGNKTYSLNQIEHDILRPQFDDPRIHFAVNCAAQSCPPLLNEAYTPERLDRQLEIQTAAFINNSKFNRLSPSKVAISKIFEWYREDFDYLTGFINKYAPMELNTGAKIEFLEYNWQLNE